MWGKERQHNSSEAKVCSDMTSHTVSAGKNVFLAYTHYDKYYTRKTKEWNNLVFAVPTQKHMLTFQFARRQFSENYPEFCCVRNFFTEWKLNKKLFKSDNSDRVCEKHFDPQMIGKKKDFSSALCLQFFGKKCTSFCSYRLLLLDFLVTLSARMRVVLCIRW